MSSSNNSFPEHFDIICTVKPLNKDLKFRISQSIKLKKIVDKIQDYLDCKVYSVYICSSKEHITDYTLKVHDLICRNLFTDTLVDDIILVNISATFIIDTEIFKELKEDTFRKDIIKHLVSNIIKHVISKNESLDVAFDITRKKRKDRSGHEVTYIWKKNPHVIFRSEKKARLFLMHGNI